MFRSLDPVQATGDMRLPLFWSQAFHSIANDRKVDIRQSDLGGRGMTVPLTEVSIRPSGEGHSPSRLVSLQGNAIREGGEARFHFISSEPA